MSEYAQAFANAVVDLVTAMSMTEHELGTLGLPVEARERLYAALHNPEIIPPSKRPPVSPVKSQAAASVGKETVVWRPPPSERPTIGGVKVQMTVNPLCPGFHTIRCPNDASSKNPCRGSNYPLSFEAFVCKVCMEYSGRCLVCDACRWAICRTCDNEKKGYLPDTLLCTRCMEFYKMGKELVQHQTVCKTFICPYLRCDMHTTGFATAMDRDSHMEKCAHRPTLAEFEAATHYDPANKTWDDERAARSLHRFLHPPKQDYSYASSGSSSSSRSGGCTWCKGAKWVTCNRCHGSGKEPRMHKGTHPVCGEWYAATIVCVCVCACVHQRPQRRCHP